MSIVHGPIEPGHELMATNRRPRNVEKPGAEAVSKIDCARIMTLKLGDDLCRAARTVGDKGLLVVTVSWEVGETCLEQPAICQLDFVRVCRYGRRRPGDTPHERIVVHAEQDLAGGH